jgi:hypothetical protein
MPKFTAARCAELKALGVESISAIPDDFRLSPRQEIIRDVARNGKLLVAPDLLKTSRPFRAAGLLSGFRGIPAAVPPYPLFKLRPPRAC